MSRYDNWLAEPYEYDPDVEYEECPECEGSRLQRDPTGEFDLDEPCEACGGTGAVEMTVEAARQRAEDERQAAAVDAAMERYYHDKYGD